MESSIKTKKQLNSAKIKALQAARNIPTVILLQRKAKCDAEALKIVERLIDPQVNETWMLQNLAHINRSHLEDVIEERAIVKLCGYALCDNPLTKIVNKQYKISTRNNKVYDIQRTKNFCSYWCYSASEYLLEQMLTSPLWLRVEEQKLPEFKIFTQPKERTKDPPGVEVNIVGIEIPSDSDNLLETESTQKSNDSMTEKTNCENDIHSFTDKCHNKTEEIIQEKLSAHQLNNTDTRKEQNTKSLDKSEKVVESISFSRQTSSKCRDEKIIKKSEFSKNNEKNKKLKEKAPISLSSLIMQVENSITEWITEDTISLIHGDDIMKQKILENIAIQDQYGELCKKLNSIQLKEEKEDRDSVLSRNDLKPAPHFSILKEQAQTLELKVRAFYEGNPVIETPITKKEINSEEKVENSVVPLTETTAPNAMRSRIFLDKLNKILPDLLKILSGSEKFHYLYTPERIMKIKALVHTFNLSASNIVFKSAQWTLVGLLITNILSIIDSDIRYLLNSRQAKIYISMILMSYKLDSNYLDELITSLTVQKK